MRERIEALVSGYDESKMSRSELIEQLTAIAGDGKGKETGSGTFETLGLNHVALAVSDVQVMADFMGEHLGTSPIHLGPDRGFLAAGANNFVGLFRKELTGLDHVCFSVRNYEPDDAAQRVTDAGMTPLRSEDRVFFRGPDGILFQVADTWGDYPA